MNPEEIKRQRKLYTEHLTWSNKKKVLWHGMRVLNYSIDWYLHDSKSKLFYHKGTLYGETLNF